MDEKYLRMTVDEIKTKLSKIEERMDKIFELSSDIELIKNDYVHVEEKTSELSTKVNALYNRPIKNWNSTIAAIVAAIISAVSTLLLKNITK